MDTNRDIFSITAQRANLTFVKFMLLSLIYIGATSLK